MPCFSYWSNLTSHTHNQTDRETAERVHFDSVFVPFHTSRIHYIRQLPVVQLKQRHKLLIIALKCPTGRTLMWHLFKDLLELFRESVIGVKKPMLTARRWQDAISSCFYAFIVRSVSTDNSVNLKLLPMVLHRHVDIKREQGKQQPR